MCRLCLLPQVRLRSVPEMGYHVGGPGPARGELCLRGPCLFSGYYKQQEATREVGGRRSLGFCRQCLGWAL